MSVAGMRVFGIIAEYNPFHNGHAFQLDAAREQGATHIIAAISGNFVQRGQAAVFDKYIRARAALSSGADLVIQLPTCFAAATADKFAFGGVQLLDSLGIVDTLFFGSECNDVNRLKNAASAVGDNKTHAKIKQLLDNGVTYARARRDAVCELYGEHTAAVLDTPNDILAVEYIKALSAIDSSISPLCVKRRGVGHNSNETRDGFASATALRQMLFDSVDISRFVPDTAVELYRKACDEGVGPNCLENAQIAVLARLREHTPAELERLCDISGEGLHNRLYNAIRQGCSLEEIIDTAKTKRYTRTRIQRLLLCAMLGIDKYELPSAVRILGMTEKGEQLLRQIKEHCSLPIVTSYSQAKQLSESTRMEYEREADYTDFYTLLMRNIQPCGTELTQGIVKI